MRLVPTELYPALYEAFVGLQDRRGLADQRRRVVEDAGGTVLEVGIGTGRNLPHYLRAERVVGIDPDRAMLGRAVTATAPCPASLVRAAAERLPFEDGTFDTVVITLTLCTIPDPDAALDEVRRVLAPGGRLRFLEHVIVPGPLASRLQRLTTPLWRRVSRGCHLDRDTPATIAARGFTVTRLWRSGDGTGTFVEGEARVAPG